jgi:hypothetical protein
LITRAVADAIISESARISPEELAKVSSEPAVPVSKPIEEEVDEEEVEDVSKPKRRVVHKKIVKYSEEE